MTHSFKSTHSLAGSYRQLSIYELGRWLRLVRENSGTESLKRRLTKVINALVDIPPFEVATRSGRVQ